MHVTLGTLKTLIREMFDKPTLYHGTSDALNFDMLQRGSYATDDFDVAVSYAEDKVQEVGGRPVVYEVEMSVSKIVKSSPFVEYEANGDHNAEMGFNYWTNNVPVPLGKLVWKG